MALLEATGIAKRFAGITALDRVSVYVDAGESVGLIGPNGAGKTTFFNCLLGMLRPDEGSVSFDGCDLTRAPVYRRARAGIGRTFQRIELFAGMSVRDHLLVAERSRLGTGRFWKDILNLAAPSGDEKARVLATLELLRLDDVANAPIESLSLGRGRLVEVGRALMTEPKLLLLDEPSSGLDASETAALADTLRAVQSERGTAVLLVEHDVEFVRTFVGIFFQYIVVHRYFVSSHCGVGATHLLVLSDVEHQAIVAYCVFRFPVKSGLVLLGGFLDEQPRSCSDKPFWYGNEKVGTLIGLITRMILAGKENFTSFTLAGECDPRVAFAVFVKLKTTSPRRPLRNAGLSGVVDFHQNLSCCQVKVDMEEVIFSLLKFLGFAVNLNICNTETMPEIKEQYSCWF